MPRAFPTAAAAHGLFVEPTSRFRASSTTPRIAPRSKSQAPTFSQTSPLSRSGGCCAFAYEAQIDAVCEQRRLPLWPRDYELEGVILWHKLAALGND